MIGSFVGFEGSSQRPAPLAVVLVPQCRVPVVQAAEESWRQRLPMGKLVRRKWRPAGLYIPNHKWPSPRGPQPQMPCQAPDQRTLPRNAVRYHAVALRDSRSEIWRSLDKASDVMEESIIVREGVAGIKGRGLRRQLCQQRGLDDDRVCEFLTSAPVLLLGSSTRMMGNYVLTEIQKEDSCATVWLDEVLLM